ncbi:MAG: ABC-ATPase domain-containing protein [Microcystaceae cyanobacterium]
MTSFQILEQTLFDLDGRSYKAYKDIKGSYQFPDFTLMIDHVQGDPFASPSRLRIKVSHSIAKFPPHVYQSSSRKIALRDYLSRQFGKAAKSLSSRRGTGKSGLISIVKVSQAVLDRTSVVIDQTGIEVRFWVGLPAQGRRILGRQAAELLGQDIPDIVDMALKYDALDAEAIERQVKTVEDADWLRSQLNKQGLVAFIANSSLLPRRSGVDDRPLDREGIPFQSPPPFEVSFNCPNYGEIKGMGIPQGITLIVGGGYHGKSTLLHAIEQGIYNHIPNDGREFVVTEASAVKIRAEDGRSIVGVDISPFINHLPQGKSTRQFSTPNASGSTSQAGNIMEALEVGTKVLLLDEDTTATNFMIRDQRMQQLIAKEKEPITPFIDKIRQLYEEHGVSTILVMGGSGDYFEVADQVIGMDNFQPVDLTNKAKEIAQNQLNQRKAEGGQSFGQITPRIPLSASIDPSRGQRSVKLKVQQVNKIGFGVEEIDLSAVEQLIESSQLQAIAEGLIYAKTHYLGENITIAEALHQLMADISHNSLDMLTPYPQGDLAAFRSFEWVAALNRLRSLQLTVCSNEKTMEDKEG